MTIPLRYICLVLIASQVELGFAGPKEKVVNARKEVVTEDKKGPAKVRIPIRLVPYHEVMVKDQNGRSKIEFREGLELNHTLRAGINVKNHFYVADYHIEAVPLQWKR